MLAARAQGHCATATLHLPAGKPTAQQVQKPNTAPAPALVHTPELGQAAASHQGSPKRTPAFIYNTPQVTYHRKERVQYNSRTQQRKGIGSPKSLQPSPQPLALHRPGSPIPASSEHRRAGGCQPSHGAAPQLGWAKLARPPSLAQAGTQEPSTQCQERVAKGRTPGVVPPLRPPRAS